MDQIKQGSIVLREKKFTQLPSIIKIRIISMPKSDNRFYYYPISNQFVQNDGNTIQFYTIKEDGIIKNIELTDNFQKHFDKKYTLDIEHNLNLEYGIYLKSEPNILKFYIDDLSRYQIFQTYQHSHSWKYIQISKHSIMSNIWINHKLRIYQLSNFKTQRSIITRAYIVSTSYFRNIVQIRQNKFIFYLNKQTNKQIRKFNGFKGYLHILNSNYIFVPTSKGIGQISQLASVKIYDFCGMKLKGILEVKLRKYKLFSYLFIKEHNILTILYSKIIDFYDLTTLGFLGSELLNEEYQEKLYYDELNGLTILKKQDTWQS